MNCYIEKHISRKLKLVDMLYYTQTTPSIEALAESIDVSVLTIRKYLKDYNLNYRSEPLTQQQRQDCYDEILSESLFYKILFLLFTSPGLSASDYSYQLAISTVNFYKQIKKLNEELQLYGIRTIVHDGYHLDCTDETMLYSVMFMYISKYNTRNKALYDMIQPLQSVIQKNDIHHPLFKFDKDWEGRTLCTLLWICLVRESQGSHKKKNNLELTVDTHVVLQFEDVNAILQVVPNASFESIHTALLFMKKIGGKPKEIEASTIAKVMHYYEMETGLQVQNIEDACLDSIKRLLEYGHALMHVFPFDFNGCSFILKDFYQDYVMMNAEFIAHFEKLLIICTQVSGVPFTYFREILFYWFIAQGGESLLLSHKKVLVVNKEKHEDKTINTHEINQLLRLIKIKGVFSEISEQEFDRLEHCTQYDLIISNVELEKHHKIIHKSSRNGSTIIKSVFDYFQSQA